jgi:hypothetical protein
MFLATTGRRVAAALAKTATATCPQRSVSLLSRHPSFSGSATRKFSQLPSTGRFGRSSSSKMFDGKVCLVRTFASSSSLTETEIRKRLDEFQDLFVEARLCIEDVTESEGTKYFDEDAKAAQESVQEALDAFEQLVADIEDPNEKNRVLRGNGLKVEQLKGELDLALKGGHDH